MSMGGPMPTARSTVNLPIAADDALCGPPLTEVPLTEADSVSLASVLAALADPVRLRLLSIVAAQGEVCSCHLTRVLTKAGLIEGEKRGKWTWWRIVPERLAWLRQALGGA